MTALAFQLEGSCGVPAGTPAVAGVANQFRLPGGAIVSVQAVIELASRLDADDHRDLSYAEAIALDLTLDCEARHITVDDAPG